MLLASAIAGWAGVAAIVITACSGILFRRWWKFAPVIRRMRPHYVLGHAALALALAHVFFALPLLPDAGGTGIRYAAAAFVVLGLQTFVGVSLQDPGSYRRLLYRWHLVAFAAILVLGAVHVVANGALL